MHYFSIKILIMSVPIFRPWKSHIRELIKSYVVYHILLKSQLFQYFMLVQKTFWKIWWYQILVKMQQQIDILEVTQSRSFLHWYFHAIIHDACFYQQTTPQKAFFCTFIAKIFWGHIYTLQLSLNKLFHFPKTTIVISPISAWTGALFGI